MGLLSTKGVGMSFTEEDLDKKYPLTEEERLQLKSKISFLEVDICNKKREIEMIKKLIEGYD
jgi:hypothetical protein